MSVNSSIKFWERRKITESDNINRSFQNDPYISLNDVINEQLASQPSNELKFTPMAKDKSYIIGNTSSPKAENDLLLTKILKEQFDREHDSKVEDKEKSSFDENLLSYDEWQQFSFESFTDNESLDEDDGMEWEYYDKIKLRTVNKKKTFTKKHKYGNNYELGNVFRAMELDISTGDECKLHLDMKLTNNVFNALKVHSMAKNKRSLKDYFDKSDKIIIKQIVDENTSLILQELMHKGILDDVDGTVSTGKESNIFHGFGSNPNKKIFNGEVAIKIYKTSLNEFKSRDKYFNESSPLKGKFLRQNTRSLINSWAVKEMHNLIRIRKEGILCPEVLMLKKHVLVMEFLGLNGRHAPCLKEAILTESQWLKAYQKTIELIKRLYSKCSLVHGDLSEYNLLWHRCNVYVIDVGQSVSINQFNAMKYLKRDCENVCKFFQKKGVCDTISSDALFYDVTGKSAKDIEIFTIK